MPGASLSRDFAYRSSIRAVRVTVSSSPQGLLLYDGQGRITYSRNLDTDIALEGIAVARQYGAWSNCDARQGSHASDGYSPLIGIVNLGAASWSVPAVA